MPSVRQVSKTSELVDIDLVFHFQPSGSSFAVSEDGDSGKLIFLPTSIVEEEDTGRKHRFRPIKTYTMPVWLAEKKGLV